MNRNWSFDRIFQAVCNELPLLGKPLLNYYLKHVWFQRFAKFGVSTTLVYWLVRAPLLWGLTEILPATFLWIPNYILAAFIVGLCLTVIGFGLNELWIWKKRR